MSIDEAQEYAEEKYGVDVAEQTVKRYPEPGDVVLLTLRNAQKQIVSICCRPGSLKKEVLYVR